VIGGLREELLGRGIVLSYLTVMLVTTTEGTMNLLFPLYLDQRGYVLAGIGTIASLYGLNAGIIDRTQFSLLVTVVVLSAVVPTAIAERWLLPDARTELHTGRAEPVPAEEFV